MSIPKATGSEIKREENPFSFKHFLKRDSNAKTGTVTNTTAATTIASSKELNQHGQKTGARPKIPLNSNSGTVATDSDSIKMKRSPKFFKSFDSQASLAEIATTSSATSHHHQHHHLNSNSSSNIDGDSINLNMYQPYHSSFNNESNAKDTHQNKFQRSYSTYDLDNPKVAFKNFGRTAIGRQRIDNNNQTNNSSFNKTQTTSSAAEISMALPDFVQDHIALEMFYTRDGSSNISPLSVEYDQLPDFAINDNESNARLQNNKKKKINV